MAEPNNIPDKIRKLRVSAFPTQGKSPKLKTLPWGHCSADIKGPLVIKDGGTKVDKLTGYSFTKGVDTCPYFQEAQIAVNENMEIVRRMFKCAFTGLSDAEIVSEETQEKISSVVVNCPIRIFIEQRHDAHCKKLQQDMNKLEQCFADEN